MLIPQLARLAPNLRRRATLAARHVARLSTIQVEDRGAATVSLPFYASMPETDVDEVVARRAGILTRRDVDLP